MHVSLRHGPEVSLQLHRWKRTKQKVGPWYDSLELRVKFRVYKGLGFRVRVKFRVSRVQNMCSHVNIAVQGRKPCMVACYYMEQRKRRRLDGANGVNASGLGHAKFSS